MPDERSYSDRSRIDKLGVKSGTRVAVCGRFEDDFLDELAGIAPAFTRSARGRAKDLVFLRAESPGDLPKISSVRENLAPAGGIWVVYPRGVRSITQDQVLRAIRAAGLTDNKVCSFSESHTALRAVIPVAQRGRK